MPQGAWLVYPKTAVSRLAKMVDEAAKAVKTAFGLSNK